MNKLKNGTFDVFIFIFYHLLFVLGSFLLFVLVTSDLGVIDFIKMKSLNQSALENVVATSSVIIAEKVRGEVIVSGPNVKTHALRAEDEIKAGSFVETKDKSAILLSFGGKYTCKIRLGSFTKVSIDELMNRSGDLGEEKSVISLVSGAIVVHLRNKRQPVGINIQTKMASFGIRGTIFSVQTDQSNYALLGVKEGVVAAESFISLAKKLITSGRSYMTSKTSGDKEFSGAQFLNQVDWDYENLENEVVTFLKNKDGKIATPLSTFSFPDENTNSLRQLVDRDELENFRIVSINLRKELAIKYKIYKTLLDDSLKYPDNKEMQNSVVSAKQEIVELELVLDKRTQVIQSVKSQLEEN